MLIVEILSHILIELYKNKFVYCVDFTSDQVNTVASSGKHLSRNHLTLFSMTWNCGHQFIPALLNCVNGIVSVGKTHLCETCVQDRIG